MRERVFGNEFDHDKPQQAMAKTLRLNFGWQWEGIGGLEAEKKRNLTHVFLKTHFGCSTDNIIEGNEKTEEAI